MTAHIRLATFGDEWALADLNAFVQNLHVENNPTRFRPAALDVVAAWFQGLVGDPTVHIWIAEEDGKPVGYASMIVHNREQNPFCHARRFVEIDQISVHPDYRRRGIGRSLLQHIIRSAHAEGIRDVELSSWSFNAGAQEVFRSLGFEPKLIRFGRESSESGE